MHFCLFLFYIMLLYIMCDMSVENKNELKIYIFSGEATLSFSFVPQLQIGVNFEKEAFAPYDALFSLE